MKKFCKDVILVSMPFGVIRRPSLGMSILKAALEDIGIKTALQYFTFPYAKRIGLKEYEEICDGWPFDEALLGEWIFANALFHYSDLERKKYFTKIICGKDQSGFFFQSGEKKVIFDRIELLSAGSKKFIEECYHSVDWSTYKIVGFSSMFQQQLASLALAKLIKENHPTIKIVFGGPNCEGVMGHELISQFDFIDLVISGEADILFPIVAKRLIDGTGLPRNPKLMARETPADFPMCSDEIARLRIAGSANLDWLPIPDFDDFFKQVSQYSSLDIPFVELLYESSRGCWWGQISHCIFCGLNGQTMAFRSKTAERAYTELNYLVEKYKCEKVQVVDNILDMKYFSNGFLDRLEKKGAPIKLFYEVKSNLKTQQIDKLKKAGISKIQPGIENLDSHVLNIIGKGVTAHQNLKFLKDCKELQMQVAWNYLYGFPGETENGFDELFKILPFLYHLPPPKSVSFFQVHRFSPIFNAPGNYHLELTGAVQAYHFIYKGIECSKIDNLAYLFAFRLSNTPLTSHHTCLTTIVRGWQKEYKRSVLLLIKKNKLAKIIDTRPVAKKVEYSLTPLQLFIIENCNDSLTITILISRIENEFAVSLSKINSTISDLKKLGLLIDIDNRLLSIVLHSNKMSLQSRIIYLRKKYESETFS